MSKSKGTGNRFLGCEHAVTIDIEDVEPWGVQPLIGLIREAAAKHHIHQGSVRATLYLDLEWFDNGSDYEGFKEELTKQSIMFGENA